MAMEHLIINEIEIVSELDIKDRYKIIIIKIIIDDWRKK